MNGENDVVFREVQRFHQPWLWVLIIVCAAGLIGLFGYGMVQQLVFGEPWGDRPMSDTALAVTGTFTILFGIGMLALFASTRLITEVRTDGLYIRFFPPHLSFRRIPLEDLAGFEARSYSPMREYGGWGIKSGCGGRAYNVSGDRGVRIDYTNGGHILIGSQRADELAQAIRSILRK
jgi:uncharacterized membrane protein